MRGLRLNGPLVLGLLLAAGLSVFLLLPWLIEVPDPHDIKPPEYIGSLTRPKAPGTEGYRWGSDMANRDVFARVIYGGRTTILVAIATMLIRATIAIPIGLIAGWYRGWVGRLTVLFSTVSGAIPSLLFIVFVLPSVRMVLGATAYWMPAFVVLLAIAGIPRVVEQVRGLTVTAASQPFVEAAIASGATTRRILFKHLLPVIRGDLVVTLAAEMALILMIMGQLAIFGVFVGGTVVITLDGVPPLTVEKFPEWGQMLSAGRSQFRSAPWIVIPPAIALGLTAACFHFLAEGLRLRWLRRSA